MNIKVLLLVLALKIPFGYSQIDNFQTYLDSAKNLFKSAAKLSGEELQHFDYQAILPLLNEAIALNGQSAEAYYYMAYTYSRMNSMDANGLLGMNLEWVQKASEALNKCIALAPEYTGEIIALDPYSKLTSEWGALATSYLYNYNQQAARSTFLEGKNQGGFSEFLLSIHRKTLDACPANAILISSGDIQFFPLIYLQVVEGYRTDVAIIDAGLLHTDWYASFLSANNIVQFDLPSDSLKCISYLEWPAQNQNIGKFTWQVPPSLYDQYLLRGNRLLLSLLKQNNFEREVCFGAFFPKDSWLGLQDYCDQHLFVNVLNPSKKGKLNFNTCKEEFIFLLYPSWNTINLHSANELQLYDFYYQGMYEVIHKYYLKSKKSKDLLEIIDAAPIH
jgi:hypothetical protein